MLKIFLGVFLYFLSLYAHAEKTMIYIYNGPGTSQHSIKHTLVTLNKVIDPLFHTVELIDAERVKSTDWEKKALLFIMPGGADLPYVKELNSLGNRKIRDFVVKGGRYLGFCAGAYYGGAFVEFAKGTSLEVVGKRELSFFPGVVKGPALKPYDYLSNSGCAIATLQGEEKEFFGETFHTFFNGGGYFKEAQAYPNTQILASYKDLSEAALIEIKVGKGIAQLSGPHWEYNPELMDEKDPYLQKILPHLKEHEERRLTLARRLLERLSVTVNSELILQTL